MASCWWRLARTPPWTMILPSCPRLVLGLWGVWESLRSGTMPADVGEDTLCDEGWTFHVSSESFGVSHGLLSSFCAAITYFSGLRDLCASSDKTACHLKPCLFGCNQSRMHPAHASPGVCSPAGGQRHHTHSVRLVFFCPLWNIWTLSLIYIQMLIFSWIQQRLLPSRPHSWGFDVVSVVIHGSREGPGPFMKFL